MSPISSFWSWGRRRPSAFPGVGQANADKLLARFGSVQRVAHATSEELIDTIGPQRGRRLHELLTQTG